MRKCVLIICSVVLFVGFFILIAPTTVISTEKVIEWDFSLWGGSRAWTKPVEQWVADMEKKTNGNWMIKIHYGGVLAPPKEALEGIKAEKFDAAGICAAHTPGKVPLHTVSELPFIAPNDVLHISQLQAALWEHPALNEELLKWNAVPLLPAALPQYHLMGNKPIRTVADLRGSRIRIGGNVGKVLKEFGAVPTMIPPTKIYEAVEGDTIDLVGLGYSYGYGAYKTFEVSKYMNIPVSLGTVNCSFIANKDAWDALPAEFQKYHMEWYENAPKIWAAEYKKADDKWIPLFKKKLEFIDFPVAERNKLVEKAEGVYEKWVNEREKEGLPGREILNYYLNKRKEIAGN